MQLLKNVVADLPSTEFFCPGSTVRATFDTDHPLAYGMPDEGLVLFWGSPAFQIEPSPHNEWYETVVRYADRDLLQSGWLIGEDVISEKAAMVNVRHGEWNVVLIGFRPQHRGQTWGMWGVVWGVLVAPR